MANTITGSITTNGLGFVKATIDGITFDKIQQNSRLAAQAVGVATTPNADVWKASGTTTNWAPSAQAVDIDWNSAHVGSTTVQTTGQLLKIIADLQTKVDQLEKAFSTLATNVGALVTITNG